jgi:hypothetical protein
MFAFDPIKQLVYKFPKKQNGNPIGIGLENISSVSAGNTVPV